jgi:hypothetical protein
MIIQEEQASVRPDDRLGVITRDFSARLVNFSPSGCLIESNAPIPIGTVGSLRFRIAGEDVTDDVQIVRCDLVPGAGSLYHVGARFLWTVPPVRGTLRHVFARAVSRSGVSAPNVTSRT